MKVGDRSEILRIGIVDWGHRAFSTRMPPSPTFAEVACAVLDAVAQERDVIGDESDTPLRSAAPPSRLTHSVMEQNRRAVTIRETLKVVYAANQNVNRLRGALHRWKAHATKKRVFHVWSMRVARRDIGCATRLSLRCQLRQEASDKIASSANRPESPQFGSPDPPGSLAPPVLPAPPSPRPRTPPRERPTTSTLYGIGAIVDMTPRTRYFTSNAATRRESSSVFASNGDVLIRRRGATWTAISSTSRIDRTAEDINDERR